MTDATPLTPPLAHERNSIVKCKQIQPIIPEDRKKYYTTKRIIQVLSMDMYMCVITVMSHPTPQHSVLAGTSL